MCGSILPNEGAKKNGATFRRRRKTFGAMFGDIFDNFILNFFVGFLLEEA